MGQDTLAVRENLMSSLFDGDSWMHAHDVVEIVQSFLLYTEIYIGYRKGFCCLIIFEEKKIIRVVQFSLHVISEYPFGNDLSV